MANNSNSIEQCGVCKGKLCKASFDSFKIGVGHIGCELGKYCKKCRILYIFNPTIKVKIINIDRIVS